MKLKSPRIKIDYFMPRHNITMGLHRDVRALFRENSFSMYHLRFISQHYIEYNLQFIEVKK